jgi:hypothetical protein
MPTPLRSTYLVLLVVAVAAPAYAQSAGIGQRDAVKRMAASAQALRQLQQALAKSADATIFSLSELPCQIGKDCKATVKVLELYDKNHELAFCAVQAQDIDIDVPAGKKPKKDTVTKISWELDVTSTANNATYYFDKGLITFDDPEGAADKTTISHSEDQTQMSISHKYKERPYELHYFPVVFQKIGNGQPAMCAAIDPKIGNN